MNSISYIKDNIRKIQKNRPHVVCSYTQKNSSHVRVDLENTSNSKTSFFHTSLTPSDRNFSRVLARSFNKALVLIGAEPFRDDDSFTISYYCGN